MLLTYFASHVSVTGLCSHVWRVPARARRMVTCRASFSRAVFFARKAWQRILLGRGHRAAFWSVWRKPCRRIHGEAAPARPEESRLAFPARPIGLVRGRERG